MPGIFIIYLRGFFYHMKLPSHLLSICSFLQFRRHLLFGNVTRLIFVGFITAYPVCVILVVFMEDFGRRLYDSRIYLQQIELMSEDNILKIGSGEYFNICILFRICRENDLEYILKLNICRFALSQK